MGKDYETLKKNKKSFKRFVKSFGYSGEGIKYAFYHEQNIIVMFFMAIIAIVLGLVFNITYMERLVILVLIGMILSLEMINTAIEAAINLHDGNKKSKEGKTGCLYGTEIRMKKMWEKAPIERFFRTAKI